MKLLEKAFELQPAIERLGSFVRDTNCLPTLTADRDSLLAVVQQVEQLHANLGTPLRLLLVGGTGVGKSSLLNAIAGADVAQVSHRRPTTQRLTAYFHREDGTASLGALEVEAMLRPHERETLREKIILDAPDFDSSVQENHENLFRALEVADLVICVVTPEKYMSRELFHVLAKYQHGRRFVHALNKADLGVDPAVVEDFQRALAESGLPSDRVFRLSARAAFEDLRAGRSPGAAAGEFPELMNLIEHELDRVRIREIKSHNLVDRVERLLVRLERHVPPDADARLESWQRESQASFRELAGDLTTRFTDVLFSSPELRNVAAYCYGQGFDFIFGTFLRLAQWLRAVGRAGLNQAIPRDLDDVKTLLHDRLSRTDAADVVQRVQLLLQQFVEAGIERGFARAFVEPQVRQAVSGEDVRLAYREIEGDWAGEFSTAFRDILSTRTAGADARNLAFNAVPGIFAVWVVYQVFAKFLAGVPLGTDYLVSALVIEAVICWAQWRLAEIAINRSVDRTFARMTEHLRKRVEARLSDRFLQGTGQAIAQVRGSIRDLAAIRTLFSDIARACADPAGAGSDVRAALPEGMTSTMPVPPVPMSESVPEEAATRGGMREATAG